MRNSLVRIIPLLSILTITSPTVANLFPDSSDDTLSRQAQASFFEKPRKSYYITIPITYHADSVLYSQAVSTDLVLSLVNGLAYLNDRFHLSNHLTYHPITAQATFNLNTLLTTFLGQLGLRALGLWIFVFNHEWSGHVTRVQEFGGTVLDMDVETSFGIPTGNGMTLSLIPRLSIQEHAMIDLGGIQANALLAQKIVWQRLKNRQPFDNLSAWVYIFASRDQFNYIALSSKLKNPDGDVLSYLHNMQRMYGKEAINLTQLQLAARLDLLDPVYFLAWYSLYYSLRYEHGLSLPMIPCGKLPGLGHISLLPSIGLVLTPYNVLEQRFYLYIDTDYTLIKLSAGFEMAHKGITASDTTYYLEAKIDPVFSNENVNLGMTVAVWKQPEILDPPTAPLQWGGMAIFHIHAKSAYPSLNFFADIGYKTQGFVLGRSINASAVMQVGFSLEV